ncbi:purine-nucleoside phosphorylase [Bacillus sp. AFS077874]|uniref:purine-nucleoside phosphorylase n=1 Tax=unclassified Bacillus (in: firmicutes) TaxID=185979 RepID=UPI000BEB5836|nr:MULTISPECIES: purine-nucleoside phosphorylase [unclassified Bacillus (in: firmicutes)]PEC48653.1 purine-nucleoside phosphorylase [Bacillus sp. AFS096315]PFM82648.1 purine-nucleoside phosphorylase [Bacillus sp. AFS077874]
MTTPHNTAKSGEIAKTVLMPGDPLRAKYIAETYLENPEQFNTVRNMFGYTGTYKGQQISVMGSGMGMPSIGIYSYELYKFYDVENIIRVGSAGAYTDKLNIHDIVLVDSAWSQSTFAKTQAGVEGDVQYPCESLTNKIEETAKHINTPVVKGRIHSSDVFYYENSVPNFVNFYKEHNCICTEMESFALFHNAKVLGKKAACLLTISDSLVTHEEISAEARQTSFDKMMKLALEACL